MAAKKSTVHRLGCQGYESGMNLHSVLCLFSCITEVLLVGHAGIREASLIRLLLQSNCLALRAWGGSGSSSRRTGKLMPAMQATKVQAHKGHSSPLVWPDCLWLLHLLGSPLPLPYCNPRLDHPPACAGTNQLHPQLLERKEIRL